MAQHEKHVYYFDRLNADYSRFVSTIVIFVLSLFILSFFIANYVYAKGLAEGEKQALKTNPVSDKLEMVCAGLWIGEQNKKYGSKQ